MILEQPIPQTPDVGDTDLKLGVLNRKVAGTPNDLSDSANNMTEVGVPEYQRVGAKFGGSADGLSVDVATATAYPFSISGWFKSNDVSLSWQVVAGIMDKDVSTIYYAIQLATSRLEIVARNTTPDIKRGTTDLEDGRWYHVAAVFKSATLRTLYLDSVVEAADSSSVTMGAVDRTSVGYLGRAAAAAFFDGEVRDARIHDRELSQKEITAMFRAGIPDPDLAGLWLPREGSLRDVSRYRYDMTAVGNPTLTRRGAGPFTTSDYLRRAQANWRDGDSFGTFMAWFKLDSVGSVHDYLFSSSDEAGATKWFSIGVGSTDSKLRIAQTDASPAVDDIHGSTVLVVGKWYHAAWQSTGTGYKMFLNGVEETIGVTTGADTGDWLAETSARDNITIGVRRRNTVAGPFRGEIFDLHYNNAVKSAEFIKRYYERTQVYP